jgi:hypothetical protein
MNFNAKAQTDSTFEVIVSANNYAPCINDTVQLSSVFNLSPYYNSYTTCGTNGSLCNSGSTEKTFSSGAVSILGDFSGPFESSSSKYQYIYTAAELQAKGIYSGAFNSLSFDVDWNNISGNINNLSIYMNCTSSSAFSSSGSNTFLPEGDVVYSTGTFTTNTGWNPISFDNTFDWDGVTNIVITVCHSGSALASNMGIECTDINSYRTLGKNGSCATANPTFANQFRPNMKLGICNPTLGALTYTWTPSTGLSNAAIANPTFVATSSPQSYVLSVTDGILTRSDTVDIGVGITPTAVASIDTTICDGESVLINATGGTTYTWNSGLGNGQSHTVSPSATTTYQVIVASTDGCTDTNNVVITVNPLPNSGITANTAICDGDSILITATGGSDYFWNNGLGNSSSHTVTPTSATTYNVTVVDLNGCENDESVTISINPLPIVSITFGTDELIASTGFTNYTWYLDGIQIASGNSNIYTDSVLLNGNYTVEVTDNNGCSNTSAAFTFFLNSMELEKTSIVLYPNPFSNAITVSSSDAHPNSSIRITDLFGKVHPVEYNYSNENIQIDGRSLPSGIYILEMDGMGKIKIVKY